MSITVAWEPPAYNKPPAPDKALPEKLFPFQLDLLETKVWVSLPQPDKLNLSGILHPEHFVESYVPDSLPDYGHTLMSALASGKAGEVLHTKYANGIYLEVQVALSGKGSSAYFVLRWAGKKFPKMHRLSIQLNPASLGHEGICDLLERLHLVSNKTFRVGAFLANATISRIDIAVDVVGVSVADLLVSAKGEGKRAHYYGQSGELETVNVHRAHKIGKAGKPTKKMKSKPMNDLLVTVYDKRLERISNGHPPPFGPAPVTRIEISKTQFGNTSFGLQSLKGWKNPLGGLRVGLIRTAVAEPNTTWLRYAEARRGGGPTRAASILAFSPIKAAKLESAYKTHKSDVLDVELVWDAWFKGIDHSGLIYLVEAAEQKSDGIPFPPEDI